MGLRSFLLVLTSGGLVVFDVGVAGMPFRVRGFWTTSTI